MISRFRKSQILFVGCVYVFRSMPLTLSMVLPETLSTTPKSGPVREDCIWLALDGPMNPELFEAGVVMDAISVRGFLTSDETLRNIELVFFPDVL